MPGPGFDSATEVHDPPRGVPGPTHKPERRTSLRPWLSSGRRFARRAVAQAESAVVDGEPPQRARRRDATYRRTIAVADALAMTAAVIVAVPLMGDDVLQPAAVLLPLTTIVVSKIAGLYDRDEILLRKTTLEEAPAILQIGTLIAMSAWLVQGLWIDGELGQRQVFGLWMTAFVLTLAGRSIARWLARRATEEERCIVIGDVEAADKVRAKLGADGRVHARVVGVIPLDEYSALDLADLEELLRQLDAHRVVIAPTVTGSELLTDLIRGMKSIGIRVSILPRTTELVGSAVAIDEIHGITLLGVRRFGLTRSSALVKRALDVAGASLGLILTAPLIAAIALVVKLDSHGPVFFRQTRVGRRGRRFKIVKFRSMEHDAEGRRAELEPPERGSRPVQDRGRPPRQSRRPLSARTSLDELSAAVERAEGRDEPGRPTAAGRRRGSPRRGLVPAPPAAHARHDRALADPGLRADPAPRDGRDRLPLPRQLVAVDRPEDPDPDVPAGRREGRPVSATAAGLCSARKPGEQRVEAAHLALGAEQARDTLTSRRAQPRSLAGIADQVEHVCRRLLDVPRFVQESGHLMIDDFRGPARPRSNHRQADRHRLDEHDPEGLVGAAVKQEPAAAEQLRDVAGMAPEAHNVAQPRVARDARDQLALVREVGVAVLRAAGDLELERGLRGGDPARDLDREVRLLRGRDVADDRRARRPRRARVVAEPLEVYAGISHLRAAAQRAVRAREVKAERARARRRRGASQHSERAHHLAQRRRGQEVRHDPQQAPPHRQRGERGHQSGADRRAADDRALRMRAEDRAQLARRREAPPDRAQRLERPRARPQCAKPNRHGRDPVALDQRLRGAALRADDERIGVRGEQRQLHDLGAARVAVLDQVEHERPIARAEEGRSLRR